MTTHGINNRIRVFLTLATLATFAATTVYASDINVNILNTATSGPQAGLFGPAGGLGETWNQPSTSSAAGLLDTGGGATGVGYSSTNLGGPDSWGTPTLGLIRDGLRNFDTSQGNSQQLVINGLTAGDLYDVWLASANTLGAFSGSNQRSNGEWSTPNVTTTVGSQAANNTGGINHTTWVEGNNFVLFENVEVDAIGEIVFDGFSINQAPTFDNRLPLNGFQIRQVALIPEPSTFGLATLALSSLGFVGLRRRRR